MTLTVSFRTKAETYSDGQRVIRLPALKRRHADMNAFRRSRAFGGFANSDLFEAMLNGAVKKLLGESLHKYDRTLNLDSLPPCVTAAGEGFMTTITIEVPDAR